VKPADEVRSLIGRLRAAFGRKMEDSAPAIETALEALLGGDPRSADSLFELLYADLKERAAAHLRDERVDHSLQPTALVHEAWMRIIADTRKRLRGRGEFLAIAGRAMRRILIEHARARNALKRGEGRRVELPSQITLASGWTVATLDLANALDELEAQHARECEVAQMHLLGGMTLEEIAARRKLSHDTIREDWRFARQWLNRRLKAYGER
jgi:RNA polymerase sigma factor (TIGR02999 family)